MSYEIYETRYPPSKFVKIIKNQTLVHTLNYPNWKLKSIVIVFMSFPSVCEVCAKVCSSERELKIHMDDHEGKVGCVCHHCGANFKERKAYERHIARNHKPRDIGCLHCDHKFQNYN